MYKRPLTLDFLQKFILLMLIDEVVFISVYSKVDFVFSVYCLPCTVGKSKLTGSECSLVLG